jgi:hypothetical protein
MASLWLSGLERFVFMSLQEENAQTISTVRRKEFVIKNAFGN